MPQEKNQAETQGLMQGLCEDAGRSRGCTAPLHSRVTRDGHAGRKQQHVRVNMEIPNPDCKRLEILLWADTWEILSIGNHGSRLLWLHFKSKGPATERHNWEKVLLLDHWSPDPLLTPPCIHRNCFYSPSIPLSLLLCNTSKYQNSTKHCPATSQASRNKLVWFGV